MCRAACAGPQPGRQQGKPGTTPHNVARATHCLSTYRRQLGSLHGVIQPQLDNLLLCQQHTSLRRRGGRSSSGGGLGRSNSSHEASEAPIA